MASSASTNPTGSPLAIGTMRSAPAGTCASTSSAGWARAAGTADDTPGSLAARPRAGSNYGRQPGRARTPARAPHGETVGSSHPSVSPITRGRLRAMKAPSRRPRPAKPDAVADPGIVTLTDVVRITSSTVGDAWTSSRATCPMLPGTVLGHGGGRHRGGGRRRRLRIASLSATASCCRASAPAGAATTASRRATANAGRRRLDLGHTASTGSNWPKDRPCPSPTMCRCPLSSATEQVSPSARSCPQRGRRAQRGLCGPGDVVAIVGAGPVGPRCGPHRPTATSSRSTSSASTRLRLFGRGHHDQQRPRARIMSSPTGSAPTSPSRPRRPPSSWRPSSSRPGWGRRHALVLLRSRTWRRYGRATSPSRTGLVDTRTIPQLMKLRPPKAG